MKERRPLKGESDSDSHLSRLSDSSRPRSRLSDSHLNRLSDSSRPRSRLSDQQPASEPPLGPAAGLGAVSRTAASIMQLLLLCMQHKCQLLLFCMQLLVTFLALHSGGHRPRLHLATR